MYERWAPDANYPDGVAIDTTERYKELMAADYDYFRNNHKSLSEMDWVVVVFYKELSEQFLEEFSEYLDWTVVSDRQRLSEPFIDKYANLLDWRFISRNQIITESLVEKYKDRLDWYELCSRGELPNWVRMKYSSYILNKNIKKIRLA